MITNIINQKTQKIYNKISYSLGLIFWVIFGYYILMYDFIKLNYNYYWKGEF